MLVEHKNKRTELTVKDLKKLRYRKMLMTVKPSIVLNLFLNFLQISFNVLINYIVRKRNVQ